MSDEQSTPEYIQHLEALGLSDLTDDNLLDLILDLCRDYENRMFEWGWQRGRLETIKYIEHMERRQRDRDEELRLKAEQRLETWREKARK